ncbi:ABC transporter substrate-binding protein [Cohnella rhizosphaerae]|uniref:Extracellular solute-binding protein n=1 Tax=Cohnella rhizosphaerae TaxID=1457232 RepID=A0A9X4QRM8_9BACL|nr:extracellular solute-binding protein [Cohnella rhizosphaerae]MDG0808409.1 extracellular solute-binding protein [Cohnella rhizosphaerae]
MMNYAELTAGLEKIKQTGATPLFIPGKEGWTYQMLQAIGGVYTFPDEDVEKIVKNEEKPNDVKTLVEFANRMLALKPYINDNHMTVQIPDGYQGLLDGKYGMTVLGDWLYADLAKTDPEKVKDLGMMPITLGDDYISGVVNLSGRAFGVPSNSKHKEEAKELINFLMEPDNFKIMVAPDQGASPYEGYATDQNPFQQEMQQADDRKPDSDHARRVPTAFPDLQFLGQRQAVPGHLRRQADRQGVRRLVQGLRPVEPHDQDAGLVTAGAPLQNLRLRGRARTARAFADYGRR